MISGSGNTDKFVTVSEPPMLENPIVEGQWTQNWRNSINEIVDALEGEWGLVKEELELTNIDTEAENEYILYNGKSAFIHLEYQGFNSSTNATITLPKDEKGQSFSCLDSVIKVYNVQSDYSITEYTARVRDGVLYVPQIAYSDLVYIRGDVVRI